MQSESIFVASGDTAPLSPAAAPRPARGDDSPEARMNRRFPQKVKIADLIGLPVIDGDNRVFGRITEIVRTPEGKIRLVVLYGSWFGLFGRSVAVPIEVVAIVGKQVASMDMRPDDYRTAPTWTPGRDTRIANDQIILIALARR